MGYQINNGNYRRGFSICPGIFADLIGDICEHRGQDQGNRRCQADIGRQKLANYNPYTACSKRNQNACIHFRFSILASRTINTSVITSRSNSIGST